jgi:hypothetical protein
MAKRIKKPALKPGEPNQQDVEPPLTTARLLTMPNSTYTGYQNNNATAQKRGRPPGAENFITKEIKTAAINAATRYGVDGVGTGGLEGA